MGCYEWFWVVMSGYRGYSKVVIGGYEWLWVVMSGYEWL